MGCERRGKYLVSRILGLLIMYADICLELVAVEELAAAVRC